MATRLRANAPVFIPLSPSLPHDKAAKNSVCDPTSNATETGNPRSTISRRRRGRHHAHAAEVEQSTRKCPKSKTSPPISNASGRDSRDRKKKGRNTKHSGRPRRNASKRIAKNGVPGTKVDKEVTDPASDVQIEPFGRDSFPTLVASDTETAGRKSFVCSGGAWSGRKAESVSLKRDASATPPHPEPGLDPLPNTKLTVLSASGRRPILSLDASVPATCEPTQHSTPSRPAEHSKVDFARLAGATDPISELHGLRARRRDMTKLRNRWWDILKHRPPEEVATNERDDSADVADSCSGSESDDEEASVRQSSHSAAEDEAGVGSQAEEPLYKYYSASSHPLHESIRRDDATALRSMLESPETDTNSLLTADQSLFTPLHLAVDLDRPHLVRILLSSYHRGRLSGEGGECDSSLPAPLLLAAQRGYEECLQILLSWQRPSSLFLRDSQGNNVLHYCCKSELAQVSALRFVLRAASDCSVLPKLLSSKNVWNQTPLHVACEHDRVDLVETILSKGSLSLLSKVLAVKDALGQTPLLAAIAAGSTDLVMSLLMWRGNNHQSLAMASLTKASKVDSATCPLVWATKHRNVDMVVLLLEFNSPSGKGYNLTTALHASLVAGDSVSFSEDEERNKVELVRVLVQAGANPCSVNSPSANCALTVAVENHDCAALISMLDTYQKYLHRIQSARRSDPVLQKQPESFFAGPESQELAEKNTAIRDALVTSLFSAVQNPSSSSFFYSCSLALFRRRADLGQAGLERLRLSLSSGKLLLQDQVPLVNGISCAYETRYNHAVGLYAKKSGKADDLQYWSQLLMHVLDFESTTGNVRCSWMRSYECVHNSSAVAEACVELVSEDGERFAVHESIVSQKSAKLAAAIRFASMSGAEKSDIRVEASGIVCRQMVEHMYHGSIGSGLPSDPEACCQNLLELILTAEEFICWSLVQECEMRLVSSDPQQCLCCSCQNSIVEDQNMCRYRVFGPSACITSETVLDVLAVAQHVSEAVQEADYELSATTRDSQWHEIGTHLWRPLEALHEACVTYILQNFDGVAQSRAFALHSANLSDGDYDPQTSCELLLAMCLGDLSAFPSLSSSSRNNLGKMPGQTK